MSDEISVRFNNNIPKILAKWEEQARKEILSSRGLTSLVLKDSLKSFLAQVAKALSPDIRELYCKRPKIKRSCWILRMSMAANAPACHCTIRWPR